ncbi:MAG: 6-bladed beta-propeller, partial [Phycisphaerae bacterium]|nr:6-bladed beta-propeller [Phycisphaerae bacterium]
MKRTFWLPVLVGVIIAFPFASASAQIDPNTILSNLPSDLQGQIEALLGGTDLSSLLGEADEGDEAAEVTELPSPCESIDRVRANNPGRLLQPSRTRVSRIVNGARSCNFNYGFDEIVVPEDEPSFGERICRVFLNALVIAFQNIFDDDIIPDPNGTAAYAFDRAWGTQGTGNGQFDLPDGIAIDAANDVYVADTQNNRIQRFSDTGELRSEWGVEGSDEGEFLQPRGVAVDSAGEIYVADTQNNRIQVFDEEGTFLREWGTAGEAEGEFLRPQGIAIDADDNVYVADTENDRVQVFTSEGDFVRGWGTLGDGDGELFRPQGIAVDDAGNVFVADTENDRVQRFATSGEFVEVIGERGTGNGQFIQPEGVAVDTAGNIFVTDSGNNRVQRLTRAGAFLTTFGSQGTANGQFRQ